MTQNINKEPSLEVMFIANYGESREWFVEELQALITLKQAELDFEIKNLRG